VAVCLARPWPGHMATGEGDLAGKRSSQLATAVAVVDVCEDERRGPPKTTGRRPSRSERASWQRMVPASWRCGRGGGGGDRDRSGTRAQRGQPVGDVRQISVDRCTPRHPNIYTHIYNIVWALQHAHRTEFCCPPFSRWVSANLLSSVGVARAAAGMTKETGLCQPVGGKGTRCAGADHTMLANLGEEREVRRAVSKR
jgi:hypothetical protein